MNRTISALVLAAALSAAGPAMTAEKTVTLAVDNMYCSACPYTVKQSLAKVAGVGEVAVSYEKKTAIVSYDDQRTTVAALTAATTQAGYPSHPITEPGAAFEISDGIIRRQQVDILRPAQRGDQRILAAHYCPPVLHSSLCADPGKTRGGCGVV